MRIALITGGAGGLGLATAKRFARDGMTVAVADIDGAAAEKAATGLDGEGHRGIALDVSKEDAVIAAFDKVEREMGPVSVLAHFAGTIGAGGFAVGITLADSTVEDWDKVMAINARGTFLCVREMSRRRRKVPVEHGRVITVSSLAGEAGGLQSGTAYSASKAAVLGLTRTAARDLGPFGVTVNAIAPGLTLSERVRGLVEERDELRKLADQCLLGPNDPLDMAYMAVYLASDAGAFTSGEIIRVDGGYHVLGMPQPENL